jgi:hypothetical protein
MNIFFNFPFKDGEIIVQGSQSVEVSHCWSVYGNEDI